MILARHSWLVVGLIVLTLAWGKACAKPVHAVHSNPPAAADGTSAASHAHR